MTSVAMDPELRGNFIDGAWRPALSGTTRIDLNPADTSGRLG